jgi:cystathionine beta-lyase
MTHKSIPAEKRRAAGVKDSLIRLSIGLEEAEDLIADLASVLDSLEMNESSEVYATSSEC